MWRGGLKWHSTHLQFVSPSLCCLCVCSRCWGGPGKGSGEHSAASVPASRAQPGLILQGLPLLWQVLPHLSSSQSSSADTHRSVYVQGYHFPGQVQAHCISLTMKHLLSSCKIYFTTSADIPSGVRLTYWFMNIGLIRY